MHMDSCQARYCPKADAVSSLSQPEISPILQELQAVCGQQPLHMYSTCACVHLPYRPSIFACICSYLSRSDNAYVHHTYRNLAKQAITCPASCLENTVTFGILLMPLGGKKKVRRLGVDDGIIWPRLSLYPAACWLRRAPFTAFQRPTSYMTHA